MSVWWQNAQKQGGSGSCTHGDDDFLSVFLIADWLVVVYGVGAIASRRAVFRALFLRTRSFSTNYLTETQWLIKTVQFFSFPIYVVECVIILPGMRVIKVGSYRRFLARRHIFPFIVTNQSKLALAASRLYAWFSSAAANNFTVHLPWLTLYHIILVLTTCVISNG